MESKEIVQELSSSKFSNIISYNGLSVIKFYAEWCMPCVMMGPVFDSVAEGQPKVKFGKVNIDGAEEIAQKYDIEVIPCIVFFKNSKEVDRQVGSCSEEELQEKIKNNL